MHLRGGFHDGADTQIIILDHELQILAQKVFHQTLTVAHLPFFNPVLHRERLKTRKAVKPVRRNHELCAERLVIIVTVLGSRM